MNCKSAKQQMIFLAEGSLAPTLAAAMQEHLAGCSNCSLVYNEIRQTLEEVDSAREIKTDPWFAGRTEQAFLNLQNHTKPSKAKPAIAYIRAIPIAASLVLSLYLGIYIGSELSSKYADNNKTNVITTDIYDELVTDDIYERSFETFFLTNGEF